MGGSGSRRRGNRVGTKSRERATRRSAPPASTAAVAPAPALPAAGDRGRWQLSAALGLIVAVIAIYAPVAQHPFIGFDDPQYVSRNLHVTTGLGWHNVAWAFTTVHEGNWHPLTWISHMLDVELFGVDAGAHHLTNVGLHALNSVLLLVLLVQLTGAPARSAVVAALFAVHPLHVESVAWIAERKDVLSAAWWTLALMAYARYARRPGAGRYLLVATCFAAGLMSKPMVVTLPCVLLLLDLWPLGRLGSAFDVRAWRGLLMEKLPLFALSAASSVVTFVAQQQSGAVQTLDTLPVGMRLANASVSYVAYIGQLFWPRDLAVLYPFPSSIPAWQVGASLLLLAGLTVIALRQVSTRPWLAVGWFWFVGTLVPVSGVVQVGSQPMADRFTYIPYTGLFIALVWGAAEWLRARPQGRRVAAPVTLVVLGALAVLARAQVHYWRDGVTLWTHTLAVTDRNYRAHSALGYALWTDGRPREAIEQFERALAINPGYLEARSNLGAVLSEVGALDEAATHLAVAVELNPRYAEARTNLGLVLAQQGRLDEGLAHLEAARELAPDSPLVRSNLGFALGLAGRLDDAQHELEQALRLDPDYADAHGNLGLILGDLGRLEAATVAFRRALALDPDRARSHYGLGSVLDDLGRHAEAVLALEAAVRLDPGYAQAHNRLGRVRLAQGRIEQAVASFEAAVRADPTEPDYRYDLGVMLIETHRPAEAKRQFDAALALDPEHAETRALLRRLGGGSR